MPLPENFGPQSIVDLMNECWKEDPDQRPTFEVCPFSHFLFIEQHYFLENCGWFLYYL